MIVFGTSDPKHVKSEPVTGMCRACHEEDQLFVSTYVKYFHIWYIPIVTTGKHSEIRCNQCGAENGAKTDEMMAAKKSLEKRTSIPWWHFLGVIIFGCAIVFGIFQAQIRSGYTEDYIEEPMVGDVYEYKDRNGDWSLFKIVKIEEDHYVIKYNKYYEERNSKLDKLDSPSKYHRESVQLPKDVVLKMYEDGKIGDVIRKEKK